jgi:hypothetical protein
MEIVIRTHIKNIERLNLLEKTINSVIDKQLTDLGELKIFDNSSPMKQEVMELCGKYKISYNTNNYPSDTKGGLYSSLNLATTYPILCTVDDMIVGKNTKEEIIRILNNDIPQLDTSWGCIGMFACYPKNIRNLYQNTNLWNISTKALYALICHLYSKKLSEILINHYEKSQENYEQLTELEKHNLNCCDDIWVARTCEQHNLLCYNTIDDYSQHTGVNNRSFGENTITPNSEYLTNCFIGE